MSCAACANAPLPFAAPSDRVCGFDQQGLFRSANRRCETLIALRAAGYLCASSHCGDGSYERMVAVAIDRGRFIICGWRDNSPTTHTAFVLGMGDGAKIEEPLRIEMAEEVAAGRPTR